MNTNGTILVSGTDINNIHIWDPRTYKQIIKLEGHSDIVKALIVSEDGTQIISSGSDSTIKVWSAGQRKCVKTIRVHSKGSVTTVRSVQNAIDRRIEKHVKLFPFLKSFQ